MADISIAPIARLIKKAGVQRVGKDAARVLRDYLEDVAVEKSRKALEFAEHAGRKTVKAKDIELALKY